MGELRASDGTVFFDKSDDAREHLEMLVFPNTEIVWRNSADILDGDRLGEHDSGATDRTTSQMH
jgi:hypothetical protein